jgi:hypothetical protein
MKVITFLSSMLLFAACNTAPTPDTATTATTPVETPAEAPRSGVQLLQGKWQSTDDPKAEISIDNSVYKDIYDGKEVSSGEFSFSADCTDAACKSGKGANGCFSVEDQKSQMTCYTIVNLNEDALDCSLVGGKGNTNHYKKVK